MSSHITKSQRRFINDITERLTEDDLENVMDALRHALGAEKVERSPERGPGGQVQYVALPDHQIRLAAAGMILAYTQEKPAASVAVADTTPKATPEEVKARMIGNIDGFMGILAHLQKLEREKTQPIDVTPGRKHD